jgi:hypothetical protein
MPPIPSGLRPGRLLGLLTPLAVAAGLVALLLLPNLLMHTGLRSNAALSLLGSGAASQSAAGATESSPVVR